MKTLYDVLGVRRDADPETVKTAFRRAVKAHHPDLQGGDAAASEQIKIIIAANEVLSDPQQRAAYDEDLAYERRLALSAWLTVVIRSASALAILGVALIGAIEIWAAWTGTPIGNVQWTTHYRAEIATATLPEPSWPASIDQDAQPAGESTSSEARPASHSTAAESASGVAGAEAPVDVSAIDASPDADP